MNHLSQVNIGQSFNSPIGQEGGNTLGDLISILLPASLIIAGIVLFFFIIFGGITMISGAGSGDAQAGAKGKQAATYALIGFLIIFCAFWVIQLLEAITGVKFVTAPSF